MAKKQTTQAAKTAAPETVEGNIAGVVNTDGQVVALVDMPDDELHKLAADMGIDIAGKTKEEIAAAIAAETVTAEGAEQVNPDGAATFENSDPAFPGTGDDRTIADVDAQIKAANAYTVAWHVKAGGKRYEPGEAFPADLVADELLASGAVVKA